MAAQQAPLFLGFSRQEHWSWFIDGSSTGSSVPGILQARILEWVHRWQLNRLLCSWDSPGKNTGVGCHCLLQCMKVKSESEVSQSCLTLSDPMDCSLPGSSIHGILQARVLEWAAIACSVVSIST